MSQWFLDAPLPILGHLAVVLAVAWLGNLIVKKLIIRWLAQMLGLLWKEWDTNRHLQKAIRRLSNLVPAIIVLIGIDLIPGLPEIVAKVAGNVCMTVMALSLALTLANIIDALNHAYEKSPEAKTKPIKGYLQITKIVLFIVTALLVVSTIIERSPVLLLSGLGAVTAVLMLIFQDTILSFVASVQISSGDLVRVGDWVEMPNLNANGAVIDVALHTVKVQNWDKTITTLPTRRLITDPFINWRGMFDSGGRRIKRALFLDQSSIRFLTPEEVCKLARFSLLRDYLKTKEQEIDAWNHRFGSHEEAEVNRRRITNIGTLRAYVTQYLKAHPGVHQGMMLMVRQLNPTAEGLPLEIYCFTSDTAWVVYEGVQADIFDHLLAILPEFGIRVFQNPAGSDFQRMLPAAEPR